MAFMKKNKAKPPPLILSIAIGIVMALCGLFLYWATQDVPLPNNAQQRGDKILIDLSEGEQDDIQRKQAFFIVPKSFRPRISEATFAFYFKFPDGTPYKGSESPVPRDSVRVVVSHHVKVEALKSEYLLRRTQPKGGALFAVPWLMESRDGLEIYQYRINSSSIGKYFIFTAKDGNRIIAQDAGDWSRNYVASRKLSPHVEVTYLFPKHLVHDDKHFVEYLSIADSVVVKLVRSFQSRS